MSSCCQGGCQGGFPGGISDDCNGHDYCHDHDHHRDRDCFPDYFRRPFVLVASIPRNRQTGVSPKIKAIKLIFGRDFNSGRGLIDVENDIDMWQGSTRIPVRIKRVSDRHSGRRVLLVIPLVPLVGGVIYKVRVRSVFIFRNGTKVVRCRLIVFSTRCR